MAQAIRGRPAKAMDEEIYVEVLGAIGLGEDLSETFRQTEVDERGLGFLCRKGSFRILSLRGINAMEALIIKQEMLARGGDAAIPKLALRCDPRPEEVIILGTLSQISGLTKNLRGQPFRLSRLAVLIDEALGQINNFERYR
jgi:dihydropteroate synthase